EETQRRVEREYALNQLTSRFSRSLDLDSLMKLVVQELGQLPKVKEVSIHIAPQDSTTTANSDGQNEANLSNRQVPEG
ncbi:MAG: hypothetical protein OEZ02_03545, partial [Anaerolineae bacterium]|nr:hypothetical protein [Anaerolineae bacterium]